MATKKVSKKKEETVKKVWTKDRKELVSVEEVRDSTQRLTDKGVQGGREYYGVQLKNK